MQDITLKPCPFCGGEARIFKKGKQTYYIGCVNGCAKTRNYTVLPRKTNPVYELALAENLSFAAVRWNRRAEDERS